METIPIELTRLFVKVVQHGGFSKAALFLKIPKSTVSKAVTRLEALSGTKLLIRSTRSHTLTASGRAFYETCLRPIQTLEEAQKSLSGSDSLISGKLKLTAPEDLGNFIIAPEVGKLSQKYPKLSFDLHYTDSVVDLIKDGFDFAIRIGTLTESGLKSRRIGLIQMILVTTPDYLKKKKKITHPRDLLNLDCLTLSSTSLQQEWKLKTPNESLTLSIQSRIKSNQMSSVLRAVSAGAGIAMLPHYLCKPELESGSLVQALPQWRGSAFPVSIVSPFSVNSSGRLRLVTEAIGSAISSALAPK